MYTEFFRLNRKPFKANPKGPEVFVGPQTARIVSSMKVALAGHDAIVAVCGTAGIGKSTLVNRALDTFVNSMEVVRMPRAQLRHDEVLDFLLARMASKIRRRVRSEGYSSAAKRSGARRKPAAVCASSSRMPIVSGKTL